MTETNEENTEERKYFRSHIVAIDRAIENEDWFSGFSNAVTYFEYWGYWRLHWYCLKEHIEEYGKTKYLNASSLLTILYLLKEIDANTFNKMIKVIKERNKLIHPISTDSGMTYRDTKEKDRATELLNDAKECISKVKEGVGKHNVSHPAKQTNP